MPSSFLMKKKRKNSNWRVSRAIVPFRGWYSIYETAVDVRCRGLASGDLVVVVVDTGRQSVHSTAGLVRLRKPGHRRARATRRLSLHLYSTPSPGHVMTSLQYLITRDKHTPHC